MSSPAKMESVSLFRGIPMKPRKPAIAKPQPAPRRSPPFPNFAIQELPGLDVAAQTQLIEHNIRSTLQLWARTMTTAQQQTLASELQIHPRYVQKWAALANLSRLPSVGCRYCGLLLHAGIASPEQLAQTPFQRVHQLILRLQVAELQRKDLCPSLQQVSQWVQEAIALTRAPVSLHSPNRDTKTSP